jgi:hypothetical protein
MEVLSITPAKDEEALQKVADAAAPKPRGRSKKQEEAVADEPVAGDNGLQEVFISSSGKDTVMRKDAKGKERPHVAGAINGIKFFVPCNIPTSVTPDVYGAIQGLLDYEQGHRHRNPEDK